MNVSVLKTGAAGKAPLHHSHYRNHQNEMSDLNKLDLFKPVTVSCARSSYRHHPAHLSEAYRTPLGSQLCQTSLWIPLGVTRSTSSHREPGSALQPGSPAAAEIRKRKPRQTHTVMKAFWKSSPAWRSTPSCSSVEIWMYPNTVGMFTNELTLSSICRWNVKKTEIVGGKQTSDHSLMQRGWWWWWWWKTTQKPEVTKLNIWVWNIKSFPAEQSFNVNNFQSNDKSVFIFKWFHRF